MSYTSVLLFFFMMASSFCTSSAFAQIQPLSFVNGRLSVQASQPLEVGQRFVVINAKGKRVAIMKVRSSSGEKAELSLEKGRLPGLKSLRFVRLTERRPKGWMSQWGMSLGSGSLQLPVELSSQVKFNMKGSSREVRVFGHRFIDLHYLIRPSFLFSQWATEGESSCRSGQVCVYKASHLGLGLQILRNFQLNPIQIRCGVGLDLVYAISLETNVFEESSAQFQQPMQILCDISWRGLLVGMQGQIIPSQAAGGVQPGFMFGYFF